MGSTPSEILPLALGIALSPIPIIAVILMLFTPAARRTGPAFLAGWLIGVTAVVVAAIAIGTAASSSEAASPTRGLVQLGVGLLLVALAVRSWRARQAPGEAAPMPKWMSAIDSVTAGRAFGLALLLSAANPKNLLLGLAAGTAIAAAGLDTRETIVSILVFVIVASSSVIVSVVYYLVGGEAAKVTLEGWKAWLAANNAAVMAVLLLIIGVKLGAAGLGALTT